MEEGDEFLMSVLFLVEKERLNGPINSRAGQRGQVLYMYSMDTLVALLTRLGQLDE
jgi:hypothetical protein